MTKETFNQIKDINHKANIVWDCGDYIDERINYNRSRVKVYSLFNFLVEVEVNIYSLEITDIKALETIHDYEPYLRSIKLENLY